MPRAFDPSLFGNQLPIVYDPLSRIDFQTIKPDFDLDALFDQIRTFVVDFLFPVIKELTGVRPGGVPALHRRHPQPALR